MKLNNWRIKARALTEEGSWEMDYERDRDKLTTPWIFALGQICGYAMAHGVTADMIDVTVEEWVESNDGHAGGSPHWCRVE